MRLARIFCAALSFFCAALAADDFEQLRAAAARGDYSAAVPALQAAAERDDPRAIGLLAFLYQQGQGFPRDAAKARALYTRAAELGDAEAQFNLGNMYRSGDGMPVDEAWALTYYRQAAAQGHTGAARHLEALYRAAGLSPAPASASVSTQQAPALAPMKAVPAATTSSAAETGIGASSHDELRAIELARAAGINVVLNVNAMSPAVPLKQMMRTAPANSSAEGPSAFTPASAASDPDTLENNEEGKAAYETAQRYLRGQGVPRDQGTALQWLQRAARAGHPEAKYELALRYLNGQGVTADEAMAITLLRDTAQAGHVQARAKLKQVYAAAGLPMPELSRPQPVVDPMPTGNEASSTAPTETGQATAQRQVAAMSPTTTANAPATESQMLRPPVAVQGATPPVAEVAGNSDTQAAALTGEHHATRGAAAGMMADAAAEEESDLLEPASDSEQVPLQTPEATATQPSAAANASKFAQAQGPMSSSPEGVTSDASDGHSSVTLADARAALDAHELTRAASIFTTLAKRGDAEAQAHIGYMTYQGEGVPGDKAKAVQWYRKAAQQGNRDAQYNLAVALAFGDGVARNDAEALQWYRRAAEQGSAVAQYSLGLSYALGDGAVQSDKEAMKWYSAAAEQGYADAQYNLGEMLHVGRGGSAREHDALHWFREAARNGNASAQYRLGNFHRDGRGVSRDITEATHWYELAAAQGHREAQAELAALQAGR